MPPLERIDLGMPFNVEASRPKTILFVTVQAVGIPCIELAGVRIVMTCFALPRRRSVSMDTGIWVRRMTSNTLRSDMRFGQRIDLGMTDAVEPRWRKTLLRMTILAIRIATLKLPPMRIVVASFATPRRRHVSMDTGVRVGRMARDTFRRGVGFVQTIDFGVPNRIESRRREVLLLVAVQTIRIAILELPAMGIIVTTGAIVDTPAIVCPIRIGKTLRVGQVGRMTCLASHVRVWDFQGKAAQGM